MPLYLFYTMVQKGQKWPKTQIKGGGSCLNNLKCPRQTRHACLHYPLLFVLLQNFAMVF